MSRPTLRFDGDCGFCRDAVARWEREAGDAVAFEAADEPIAAVEWIDGDDRRSGAAAVFAVLRACGRPRWAALYAGQAWFASLTERVYRWIAEHRALAGRAARRVWGTERTPATHALTGWLFLRLLGVIYLLAFVSLWTQAFGLFGAEGLLPIPATLADASRVHGGWAPLKVPTLFWLSGSDRAVGAVCAAGVFGSLLLIQGIAPRWALGVLWACYLSLVSVGGSFTAYQWDDLLLEVGLLAILLAPSGLWPRYAETPRPPPLAVFLLRLVLFKLMFLSGVVKVLSKDNLWRELKALEFHFFTQPLPTPIGIRAAELPEAVLRIGAGATLAIEIGVPFLMFFLREAWARWIVFVCFAGLQVLIALTGNYGFFNLLTLTLCLLVLQDDEVRRVVPKPLRSFFADRPRRATPFRTGVVIALVAAPLFALNVLQMAYTSRGRHLVPHTGRAVLDAVRPFRSCNGYGLFARMTTTRDGVAFEGTQDGVTWERYQFRYLDEPGFVPPGHMPRLDWGIWLAVERRRWEWFAPVGRGLIGGSPAVRRLLGDGPKRPPRDVRLRLKRSGAVVGGWSRRR